MIYQNRCGWSTLLSTLGWILIVLGLITFLFLPSLGFKSALLITIASSILGGINLLFLSFITQLIFECRNYLKEIFDSKTKI